MPKQTFFNLSDKKRTLIEEVATDEFAAHGFEGASISAMVARAGIAKGSFYQYFEDKRDLFLHLVHLVQQRKLAYFRDQTPPNPDLDLFAYLRWMFEAGMAFAARESRLNQAVSRVLFAEGLYYAEIFREAREQTSATFAAMIERAVRRGDIDPRVDGPTAAFMLETLLNSLGLFMLSQQSVSAEALSAGSLGWLRSERAQQITETLMRVLEHGLKRAGH
jgi:AcrR family transcriptional regulator